MKRVVLVALCALIAASSVGAQVDGSGVPLYNRTSAEEEKPGGWQENRTELPAFPRDENLVEVVVSAVATNTYLVDASTLTVGSDGVVRYVLVVQTAGGALNVSHEGIHCQERNWKLYATGRRDGTWSPARLSEWRRIENKTANRHHAALSREYFCPNGEIILSADEGRNALRLGKHPRVLSGQP